MIAGSVVYMTVVSLVAITPGASSTPDAAMVHDVIWAFATPETRLEHVRVVRNTAQIDIAVFCMAGTESKGALGRCRCL